MADLAATSINCVTMTIQLIDCEPDGVRICRVKGESLVTVVVPRDRLAAAIRLPQIPLRGIYYLLDEDHGNLSKVYAGQTIQGLARLEGHKSKKDFWNKAVMFLDEDYNIDRDVLDPLEATAIEYVRTHGAYSTDNLATPNPRLSPYERQRVVDLHEKILFRMKVLGYDLDYKGRKVFSGEGNNLFYTTTNGVHAIGRYDVERNRFVVLAGSEVDLSRQPKTKGVAAMRIKLFDGRSGKVTLTEDVGFTSPSSAAEFVLGGSRNGQTEWKTKQGQTFKYVYRSDERNQGVTE